MAVTRGLEILVYAPVDGVKTAIGGQRGCTLSVEADTIDISNKNDYGWASTIGGAKSWSVSCDGQFIADDAGQQALMEAFVNGDNLEVEMKNADESVYFAGVTQITSMEIDAQFDDVCTLSMELAGIGALAVKKGE
ncbi:MAG: phage major tail protein, TP901-1 family [Romboutsia timonensis]